MMVSFDFDLGDRVEVVAIGMRGLVDALMFASNGCSYRVIYWNDGRRYSEWLHAWELKRDDS